MRQKTRHESRTVVYFGTGKLQSRGRDGSFENDRVLRMVIDNCKRNLAVESYMMEQSFRKF